MAQAKLPGFNIDFGVRWILPLASTAVAALTKLTDKISAVPTEHAYGDMLAVLGTLLSWLLSALAWVRAAGQRGGRLPTRLPLRANPRSWVTRLRWWWSTRSAGGRIQACVFSAIAVVTVLAGWFVWDTRLDPARRPFDWKLLNERRTAYLELREKLGPMTQLSGVQYKQWDDPLKYGGRTWERIHGFRLGNRTPYRTPALEWVLTIQTNAAGIAVTSVRYKMDEKWSWLLPSGECTEREPNEGTWCWMPLGTESPPRRMVIRTAGMSDPRSKILEILLDIVSSDPSLDCIEISANADTLTTERKWVIEKRASSREAVPIDLKDCRI